MRHAHQCEEWRLHRTCERQPCVCSCGAKLDHLDASGAWWWVLPDGSHAVFPDPLAEHCPAPEYPNNCEQHPGAWCASCDTCKAVRAGVVRVHGTWSLGDAGPCNLPPEFLVHLAACGIDAGAALT